MRAEPRPGGPIARHPRGAAAACGRSTRTWTDVEDEGDEIQELDDSGEYTAVEVADPEPGQGAGGVVQLRQGQQRRLCARVAPVASCGGGGGALPVICDSIVSVAVGSPCVRSKLQKPLDSYQVSVVILTGNKFHRDLCPGG